MVRFSAILALGCFATGSLAEWKPADAVNDLDAVELALHKVETAQFSAGQKKSATHAVAEVEKIVEQIKTDKKMTKSQKKEKVKAAIQELQNLQSQWELNSVEGALKNIVGLPNLSPKQRAAATTVVTDVDSIVEQVTAGKLTGDARNKKVALAIQELQGLQRDWLNTTTAARVEELKAELAAKQALLKKDDAELKLAKLSKELAEKKMLLKKLVAQKNAAESSVKERKEDSAEQAMVAKLLATAKSLAARKPQKETKSTSKAVAGSAKVSTPADVPAVAAILSDLEGREHNLSASIARMDAEENKREADMNKAIEAGQNAPTSGKTDATVRSQKMMKMLLKQEHRKYLKARGVREAQRQELDDGVQSIKKGDVAALSNLMAKMQGESKSMQSKTKNFLY